MNPRFISIPFKTESEHGITSFSGIAKFSPAGIVLEFESKFLGLIPGGVKEVKVAIADLMDVKFKKGFFRIGAKIIIRTHAYSTLVALPNTNGRVTLKIAREDFAQAENAVARLQKDIETLQAGLPPVQTSVNSVFIENDSEDETKMLSERDQAS